MLSLMRMVCSGGGGIPTMYQDGKLVGVEAVIDKDLCSELLARELDAGGLTDFADLKELPPGARSRRRRLNAWCAVRPRPSEAPLQDLGDDRGDPRRDREPERRGHRGRVEGGEEEEARRRAGRRSRRRAAPRPGNSGPNCSAPRPSGRPRPVPAGA